MSNLKAKTIVNNQKNNKKLKDLSIEISFEQIVSAVMHLDKKERGAFIEDLLAATSPEYLESIKEARQDYKDGKVYNHKEAFGEYN